MIMLAFFMLTTYLLPLYSMERIEGSLLPKVVPPLELDYSDNEHINHKILSVKAKVSGETEHIAALSGYYALRNSLIIARYILENLGLSVNLKQVLSENYLPSTWSSHIKAIRKGTQITYLSHQELTNVVAFEKAQKESSLLSSIDTIPILCLTYQSLASLHEQFSHNQALKRLLTKVYQPHSCFVAILLIHSQDHWLACIINKKETAIQYIFTDPTSDKTHRKNPCARELIKVFKTYPSAHPAEYSSSLTDTMVPLNTNNPLLKKYAFNFLSSEKAKALESHPLVKDLAHTVRSSFNRFQKIALVTVRISKGAQDLIYDYLLLHSQGAVKISIECKLEQGEYLCALKCTKELVKIKLQETWPHIHLSLLKMLTTIATKLANTAHSAINEHLIHTHQSWSFTLAKETIIIALRDEFLLSHSSQPTVLHVLDTLFFSNIGAITIICEPQYLLSESDTCIPTFIILKENVTRHTIHLSDFEK
jgi:hypothetical protein